MKIIIVDDTTENLDAAKNASKNFLGHEFLFFSSATEAAEALEGADAIISDLFFPPEDCSGLLGGLYENYKSEMNHPIFHKVALDYYGGDLHRANQKKADALALLEDGTIRHAVDGLIKSLKDVIERERYMHIRKMREEGMQEYEEVSKNLPTPQFPYGGALILEAKKRNKAVCLVSDIHRHACEYKDAVGSIDGMVLLIPLMGAGIFSVMTGASDGKLSVTYIGGDEVYKIGRGERKASSKVWKRAIENCIAQKVP